MNRPTAIVVLTPDVQACRNAFPVLRHQLQNTDAHVILPEGCAAAWAARATPAGIAEEMSSKLGAELHLLQGEATSVAECIDEIAARSVTDWIHVYSGDTLLGGGWRPTIEMAAQATFCAVGPVGPHLTGPQYLDVPGEVVSQGFAAAAMWAGHQRVPPFVRADVLDASCFVVRTGAWKQLGGFDAEIGEVSADIDGDLTWLLRDWLARARALGLSAACSPRILAGRTGPARLNPHRRGTEAGVDGWFAYLAKHAPTTKDADHSVFACWVVQPQNKQQFLHLEQSIASACRAGVDGVHVLICGDPSRFQSFHGKLERILIEDPTEAFIRTLGAMSVQGVQVRVRVIGEVKREDIARAEASQTAEVRSMGATWRLAMLETEILDSDTKREDLDRLMRHPDPLVTTYNVATPTLLAAAAINETRPFGDGGTDTADGELGQAWRLHRTTAFREDAGGGRVASLRLYNHSEIGRAPATGKITARRAAVLGRTRIHAHMLWHEAESLRDALWHLDWLHGLAERVVVNVTGREPNEKIGRIWDRALQCRGATYDGLTTYWGRGPMDLALARNSAMEAAAAASAWHMFVDPDEWWTDPVAALRVYRQAAESTDRHAWMVKAKNLRPGGDYSESRSVRLWRADAGLHFVGRVHETLAGLSALWGRSARAVGGMPEPADFWNRATPDAETFDSKLATYENLLRLTLAEHPESASHWTALATHYLHRGQVAEAMECLDRACQPDSTHAVPFRKRAELRLQMAVRDYAAALQRTPPDAPGRADTLAIVRYLQGTVSDLPATQPDPEPVPQPFAEE